jgi:hypothetical protein
MRRVSRGFLRAGALVIVLTVVAANGAFAASRDGGDDGWLARFHRFAYLLVTTLDRLGSPPG